MTMKTEPFLSGKWGWDLGEGDWKDGADENFLKFSYMLNGNVDGFVSSLPSSPMNGTAYFLTSDNTLNARIDSTWYKFPTPKGFVVTEKATGAKYEYNGSAFVSTLNATDKTKLNGIASGATVNSTDASLRDRTTHTGVQAISTVTGLQTALDAKAPLDSPTFTGTPTAPTVTGSDSSTKLATTAWVKSLGYATNSAVTSVAGKTGAVTLTKTDVGLANVDNTADTAKPVSTLQQTALDLKANLVAPTFTGTVVLPSTTSIGSVSATEISYLDGVTSSIQGQIDSITGVSGGYAPINNPTFTGTVSGITKAMVGLGNVDNTSDLSKPISTATQSALNAKQATLSGTGFVKSTAGTISYDTTAYAPLASPTFTGTVVLPSTTSIGSVTSTQLGYLVNTTSDIQTQLNNKQPLATVLTNTTASFTSALETKLNGIATGAEVNVNSDWNSVSGDSQILNKPTLGTAAAATLTTSNSDTTSGRVLRVGDGGWLGNTPTTIPSNDLDLISVTAVYGADSGVSNRPTGAGNWMVNHLARTSNNAVQVAVGRTTSSRGMYAREWESGVWGSWYKYFGSHNLLDIGTTASTARTALELIKTTSNTDVTVGSLPTVGWMGLGATSSGTNISVTAAQLNAVSATGFFRLTEAISGELDSGSKVIHIEGGDSATQYASRRATAIYRTRTRVGDTSTGVWGSWTTPYDSSNLLNIGTTSGSALTAIGAQAALGYTPVNKAGDTGIGALTATSFTGIGSGLTALNASNISTGTLADARLSSNVALVANTITKATPSQTTQVITHSSSGTLTINLANGTDVQINVSANITGITFTNAPSTSEAWSATLEFVTSGTRTISWPSGTKSAGGTLPTLSSGATDVFVIRKRATDNYMVFTSGKGMA